MRNTIQNFACNSWSKRLGLYVCFLLLMVGTIWAQNQTIKGTVLDANGESIIGASVLQKGTTNGTITDFEGGFILKMCLQMLRLRLVLWDIKHKRFR